MTAATEGLLRIGELSKRAGVSPELLRAWERRYGLLRPQRSPGGLRLYSDGDLERVRAMRRHLDAGLAAAEAAAVAVRGSDGPPAVASVADVRAELGAALEEFDEPGAQAVLDRLLGTTSLDVAIGEVVLPYLRGVGDRWERSDISIAQEHFASSVLRGRLLALARGWGLGIGPVVVLACLPGDEHDLGLIAFGLALRARGLRIAYLGADTPVDTVADASAEIGPALVVLSAAVDERAGEALPQLRSLASRFDVAVGGAAAAALEYPGIVALRGGAVAEAERVAELVKGRAA